MAGRRRVYVKPVTDAGPMGWVVLALTRWESFVDDCRRFGVRVAVCNLVADIAMG